MVLPPLVSVLSFQRIAGWVTGSRNSTTPLNVQRLSYYVERLLRGRPNPWSYTCLRRSIVLYYLLRRAGEPVALHIGVRKDDAGTLQAHAWLVKDGTAWLEPSPDEHRAFRVIASFPDTAAVHA